MGKRDDKIAQYITVAKELKLNLSDELINKVTVGLGPSIYKKDSETVSCTQSSELDTVKKNFLQKKLGLELSEDEMNTAIKKVCEAMGTSNRNKYRALFYALLAQEFKKESIYA
jgi:DNA-binding transcriptional regulator YhcF (GntR family)